MTTAKLPAAPKTQRAANLNANKLDRAYQAAVEVRNGATYALREGTSADLFDVRDAAEKAAGEALDALYAYAAVAKAAGFYVSTPWIRYFGWREAVGQND